MADVSYSKISHLASDINWRDPVWQGPHKVMPAYPVKCDPDGDLYPLAAWDGQLIELSVYFPGGSVTVIDRVRMVDNGSVAFLAVGTVHLPSDANVYKSSAGDEWIYNCRRAAK